MADQIQKIILKYEADIKDLKKGQEDLLAQMKGVEKQSKSTEKSLTSGFKKAATAVAGFLAAAKLGDIITDLANIASQAEGIEAAFNAAFEPGTLQILRKETKGTISDLELMRRALKAREFNIPRDLLAKGFEFARVQANRLGEDVNFLTDSIIDGLGRKSPLILDNLGISQAQLSEEVKKTGDFYTAVGNIIESKLGENGAAGDIESLADQQARLNADIANLKLEIAQGLTPAFKGLLTVANDVVETFSSFAQFGLISRAEIEEATMNAEALYSRTLDGLFQLIQDGQLTTEQALEKATATFKRKQQELNEIEGNFFDRDAARDRARLAAELEVLATQILPALRDSMRELDPEFESTTEETKKQREAMEELADTLDRVKPSFDQLLDNLKQDLEENAKATALFQKSLDDAFAADQDEDVPDPFDTAAFLEKLERTKDESERLISDLAQYTQDVGNDVILGIGDLSSIIFQELDKTGRSSFLLTKGIALAEIVISLQKEIAGLSAGAAPFLLNPVTAGPTATALAASIAAAKTRAAISGAIIGAQTIQGFAKGTEDAPEGWAWVGEKGPELMAIPGGSAILTNRASTNAANRALISSMNRGKTEEHIRDFYIKPALKKERKQQIYDDHELRQAIKRNKTIELGPKTIRRLGGALKAEKQRFR